MLVHSYSNQDKIQQTLFVVAEKNVIVAMDNIAQKYYLKRILTVGLLQDNYISVSSYNYRNVFHISQHIGIEHVSDL